MTTASGNPDGVWVDEKDEDGIWEGVALAVTDCDGVVDGVADELGVDVPVWDGVGESDGVWLGESDEEPEGVLDWDAVGVIVGEGEHACLRATRYTPKNAASSENVWPPSYDTTGATASANPLRGTPPSMLYHFKSMDDAPHAKR
jgi:hypothetical protein